MAPIVARLMALVLMALLTIVGTQPALAHAQLLSTEPLANAVLSAAPEVAQLVFNEPVSPLVVSLIAPDGMVTDLTDATTSGETLGVHLPPTLGEGTHVLNWRVVSLDAHPIAGALVFSIGAATGSEAPELAVSSRATSILLWASKALLFSTLFLGLGGAIFALAAPLPPTAMPAIAGLGFAGLVLAPLSLGLHGADALGLAPDAILGASAWAAGVSTSYGMTVMLLVGAFALALLSLFAVRPLAWFCWLLAAVALAISGHAGAAEPQWLMRSAVILHIAGILFWAGALLPLWLWLRRRDEAADIALARFSRFIPFAVAAIVVSGGVLATIQLGPPGDAWLAPYGVILAAKLGLLSILFTLAVWNRFRLTRPALAGDIAARKRLRRSILVEIGLVLAIFALAAGWRFTPPPRALAVAQAAQEARSVPAYGHAMDDKVMADIVITPGRAGPVTIDITVLDIAGNPIEPAGVTLTLSAPALGIEPFQAGAEFTDGVWRVTGQVIPLPGRWELVLDIRLDRFTLARIGTDIDFLGSTQRNTP